MEPDIICYVCQDEYEKPDMVIPYQHEPDHEQSDHMGRLKLAPCCEDCAIMFKDADRIDGYLREHGGRL